MTTVIDCRRHSLVIVDTLLVITGRQCDTVNEIPHVTVSVVLQSGQHVGQM